MRTRSLTLTLVMVVILVACSKKPAPDGAEQSTNQPNSAPEPTPQTAAELQPPPPEPIVIPAGTVITVRVAQALGSKTSKTGDSFSATVGDPVSVDGKVAIPASWPAQETVVDAKAKSLNNDA